MSSDSETGGSSAVTSDSERGRASAVTSDTEQDDAVTPVQPVKPGALLGHVLQGLLMGCADVIPGVSGGTVALILGIYERLVGTIHEVAASVVAFLRGHRQRARAHWRRAEFALVLPLGLGIGVALGIGSVVLPPLIEHYPVVTSAVFFGLIAGALPIPWRRIREHGGKHYALALVGAVLAFAMTGLAPREIPEPALLLVFAVAAVAICAMILPGVSGAYLLLVLGLYETTLHAVRDLNLLYIAVFVAGAAIGLGAFSKLLTWLLERRHDATMAVLVGLMAGSLRRLWPWQTQAGTLLAPTDGGALLLAVLCAVAGVAVVMGLGVVGERSIAAHRTSTE